MLGISCNTFVRMLGIRCNTFVRMLGFGAPLLLHYSIPYTSISWTKNVKERKQCCPNICKISDLEEIFLKLFDLSFISCPGLQSVQQAKAFLEKKTWSRVNQRVLLMNMSCHTQNNFVNFHHFFPTFLKSEIVGWADFCIEMHYFAREKTK